MKTCALVAASDFNGDDFRARHERGEFHSVVAVDGGFSHLVAAGVEPDFVLGDFDSLGYVPQVPNVERHPTHKDKSDLELALDWVLDRGFSRAVVYGALGGRLDHTVANLQMCARFAEAGVGMQLVGPAETVHVLVGPATLELPQAKKGTVSVFSACEESRGVTERGLEYPLHDAVLANRTTLGLSNELTGEPASVSVRDGTLFVFVGFGV